MTTIVWLRNDLRLADNPALADAASRGPVVPVYMWAPEEEGDWPPGAASRWWLHHSLAALDAALRRHRARLVIRRGPALETLRDLAAETGADAIVWNRRYEPAAVDRDAVVKRELPDCRSFGAAVLREPWTLATGSGEPYQVFTPFWRALREMGEPEEPLPEPALHAPDSWPESLALEELGLLPDIPWDAGLAEEWTPGEAGAHERLDDFVARAARYEGDRDRPARRRRGCRRTCTSARSRRADRTALRPTRCPAPPGDAEPYLRELGWREFAHHLLYHFPHTPQEPLQPTLRRLSLGATTARARAWQRGRTGIAAGRRRHARAVAHRLDAQPRAHGGRQLPDQGPADHWRQGARWFWDTLVDADLANNTLGWQWVAGCGADAAPYFRIFNPDLQASRFDADGAYAARWLGDGPRPAPLVDHARARRRALDAYEKVRRSRAVRGR